MFMGIVSILLLGAIFVRTGGAAFRRRASIAPSRPVVAGGSGAADHSTSLPPSAPVVSSNPNPTSAPIIAQSPAPAQRVNPRAAGGDLPMSTVLFAGGAPAGGVRGAKLGGAVGVFPIPLGREIGIGRDPGRCAITLPDAHVSALHARVKIDGGRLLVWDEASDHGTFLNGARIPPRAWVPVPHGAVLRFAAVDMMVQLE
jgi:pSer/pThr/pTyr-binding forkhead associated (FHA) protein